MGVVAQIQGHKPSALAEKHYRRRPLDLLRVARKIEGLDSRTGRHRSSRARGRYQDCAVG